MKILFVNEKCGFFGGVEQNIADTAAGLRARGHDCYLAYGDATSRAVADYQQMFHGCFPIPLELDGADATTAQFEDLLRRVRPDVVYLHKLPDLRTLGPRLFDARTVRMVHDHDLCCPRRHKYFIHNGRVCHYPAGWRCWLDAAFLAKSGSTRTGMRLVDVGGKITEMRRNHALDLLLVGSEFMREELLQNGFPEGKVRVLPPLPQFPPVASTAYPAAPRILYVGQLIYGKGVDLLLDALGLIKLPFEALIVGTGNAQQKLEARSRELGISDRVIFRGWVDHHQLSALYESARMVVVPSRWPEPFGMVGLEAMRHARPVVGFAAGGIGDWLEHEVNGLLVPEQDSAGLARAIEALLSDSKRAEAMGQNGRRKAESEYSFETYIDRLEAHLRGAGARSGRPRAAAEQPGQGLSGKSSR